MSCLALLQKKEREIEERAGDRFSVDQRVGFVEMPAARADQQRGSAGIQLVLFALRAAEADVAAHGVAQIDLAVDIVVPGGRIGVLEIGHEDLRAGIEGVDHHLALYGAGDFDAAIEQISRNRHDRPVAFANGCGLGQKIGQRTGINVGLPLDAAGQQFLPALLEFLVQLGNQQQRVRRENFLSARRNRCREG